MEEVFFFQNCNDFNLVRQIVNYLARSSNWWTYSFQYLHSFPPWTFHFSTHSLHCLIFTDFFVSYLSHSFSVELLISLHSSRVMRTNLHILVCLWGLLLADGMTEKDHKPMLPVKSATFSRPFIGGFCVLLTAVAMTAQIPRKARWGRLPVE